MRGCVAGAEMRDASVTAAAPTTATRMTAASTASRMAATATATTAARLGQRRRHSQAKRETEHAETRCNLRWGQHDVSSLNTVAIAPRAPTF
jgi:hypothetical protein